MDPFKEGDVEGIHDNAVAKSTAFRVNLTADVISNYVESTVLIFVIPGVRYCGCVSLITGNNNFNVENYLTHDNVFGGMTVNPNGNLYKFTHDEFSYRVVSVGVKLFNVGSETTVSGSFEICDYLINLNPQNYCFANPNFTNVLNVQQPINNSPGVFRHTKEYIDNLATINLDDQLNYSVGTIQEISDVPLMLKNLNSVHEFRHINTDYICDCSREIGSLKFRSENVNENRILVRDHIDNQFFGKLIRLNLSNGNRVKVYVVVNYEVLSTIPEIVQHARATVGDDNELMPDAPGGGARAIPGQRGPNDETIVTPVGPSDSPDGRDEDERPFRPKNLYDTRRKHDTYSDDNIIESEKEGGASPPGKGVKDVRRKKDVKFFDDNDSLPGLIDESNTIALMEEEKDLDDKVEIVREEDAIREYIASNDELQANPAQDALEAVALMNEVAEETGLYKKYYQPFKEGIRMHIDDLKDTVSGVNDLLHGRPIEAGQFALLEHVVTGAYDYEKVPTSKHQYHQERIDKHYEHVGKKNFFHDLDHSLGVLKDAAAHAKDAWEIRNNTYYGPEEYEGDPEHYEAVMDASKKKENDTPMVPGEIINMENEEKERDGIITLISDAINTPLPVDDDDWFDVFADFFADGIEYTEYEDGVLVENEKKKRHYKLKEKSGATETQSKKKKEGSDVVTSLMKLVKEDRGLRIRKPKVKKVKSAKKRRLN